MSVLCLGSVLWKRAKKDHFHEGGKVEMNNFIYRRGYRSQFLHQNIFYTIRHSKSKQGCCLFYALALYCEKGPKMTIFMRVGKWEWVTPLPSNFFLLILMIWSPCHSNLVMISSLSLKCQGHPTKGPLANITFHCYSIHL